MRKSAPAGVVGQNFAAEPDTSAAPSAGDPLWEGYLAAPVAERLGICCSGGGVRSASFSLGALQVLREEHLLERAAHLSCVSGGGYIAIAHAVMVSETLKRAVNSTETEQAPPVDPEREYFGRRPPWSRESVEETHLRNRIAYLGSRVWLVANLIYGTIRHLLPFVAAVYLFGFIVGIAMSPWLAETLQLSRSAVCPAGACVTNADLLPFVWLSVGLLALAGLLLALRNTGQKKAFADGPMFLLQYLALAALYAALVTFGLLAVLPWALLRLHDGAFGSIGPFANLGMDAASLTAIAGLIGGVVSWVAKKRTTRWFQIGVAVLTALAAPIFVLVPTIGFTYWNAQWGTDWGHDPQRLWIAAASAVYLLVMWLGLDEVTSVAHLFYRERLATAFVGYRRLVRSGAGSATLEYAQPPWDEDLDFSGLVTGSNAAKLPNLVVCAAVNLSSDLPVGRMGASFTFERDKAGGPATGYVPTAWLEARAGAGVATLPALMAVSGAAVAPSMGKMTIRALRFLMAVFDLRLGTWLPNPARAPMRASARELRSNEPGSKDPSASEPSFSTQWKRPGAFYVFREALGLNSIRRSFVYVTDGGHWENLGLVELLRRGCSRIVCIDGSGGDAMTFGTLSEAIALARSDLGVEIKIDLSEMRAPGGELSRSGFAFGRIEFPDGRTAGTLVYIRALLTVTSPEELRSYAGKDKKFPNHPTSDQFFDEERFESYRALGRHLMEQAIACGAATVTVEPTTPVCP